VCALAIMSMIGVFAIARLDCQLPNTLDAKVGRRQDEGHIAHVHPPHPFKHP